jgi:hypothetical protein
MADTFSENLRLRKQEVGQNDNTWGTLLNQTIENLDEAIAGVVSIDYSVSSGDITPSESEGVTDESRHAVLVLKGAPTSNVGLNLPAKSKVYVIRNKITNTASIRLQVTGDAGNEVKIPSDFIGTVYSDGTNVFEVNRQMNDQETVVTSLEERVSAVSAAIAASVARRDADNDFQGNKLEHYRTSVVEVSGDYTPTSADSGRTLVFYKSGADASANQKLNIEKNLPLGFNLTLIHANTSGIVTVSAGGSVSLVNTSGHAGLNNYGSGAAIFVMRQEGANSHAWVFFQGETQA